MCCETISEQASSWWRALVFLIPALCLLGMSAFTSGTLLGMLFCVAAIVCSVLATDSGWRSGNKLCFAVLVLATVSLFAHLAIMLFAIIPA